MDMKDRIRHMDEICELWMGNGVDRMVLTRLESSNHNSHLLDEHGCVVECPRLIDLVLEHLESRYDLTELKELYSGNWNNMMTLHLEEEDGVMGFRYQSETTFKMRLKEPVSIELDVVLTAAESEFVRRRVWRVDSRRNPYPMVFRFDSVPLGDDEWMTERVLSRILERIRNLRPGFLHERVDGEVGYRTVPDKEGGPILNGDRLSMEVRMNCVVTSTRYEPEQLTYISGISFDPGMGSRLLDIKNMGMSVPEGVVSEAMDGHPASRQLVRLFSGDANRLSAALRALGVNGLLRDRTPELIHQETLYKMIRFVGPEGNLDTMWIHDTYRLLRIVMEDVRVRDIRDRPIENLTLYYVEFNDTSTGKLYRMCVDMRIPLSVKLNRDMVELNPGEHLESMNAVDAIASSITTHVREGEIGKIIRQGDCILIKPLKSSENPVDFSRHLRGDEYRRLLVWES